MTLHRHVQIFLATATTTQQVIFGLEREGLSSYRFLRQYQPERALIVTDERPLTELSAEVQDAVATDTQLQFVLASELAGRLEKTRAVTLFKSAGIPHTHPICRELQETQQVTVTSNTQFFLSLIQSLPAESRPLTIGVTGTKGKSTTTSLIFAVCSATERPCFLAGNIGEPALNLVADMTTLDETTQRESIIVLELSSHQLQYSQVSPAIAVLQNITPEHLDYYPDFESYREAKAQITLHQTSHDILICNPTFAEPRKIAERSAAQKWFFALEPTAEFSLKAWVENGQIVCDNTPVIALAEIPLPGMHNVLNTLPAVLIGKHLELPAETIASTIKQFSALPHRLQFVATKQDVEYFNDSQGTTPEAVMAAVASFPAKEIILLAGGSDKGVDFTELAEFLVQHQVSTILLFPPTGEKIESAVRHAAEKHHVSAPAIIPVGSMQEAVAQAASAAQPGSVVLLSPACASFGLFKNYQDRGDQFIHAVQELPTERE